MQFEIETPDGRLKVQQAHVAGQTIFRVEFPAHHKKSPLILTRANNANSARFWTSIPQGRQQEAELFGPLIAEQIRKMG